jgi:hypothetical protein
MIDFGQPTQRRCLVFIQVATGLTGGIEPGMSSVYPPVRFLFCSVAGVTIYHARQG